MTKKKQKDWLMGPLSPKKGNAKHFVQPPLCLPPPTIVCNASMKERLQLKPSAPARPGADDFRKFGSVGMGC